MVRKALITLIDFYQKAVSPYLGSRCRYYPSCSAYALDALRTKTISEGLALILRRILRCHPLGGHGFDPVPLDQSQCPQEPINGAH